LVAQWNRNAAKRARIWLSWLPRSFVFDCYGLQTLAGQAFKCSLVMVGLIGWLDARKKLGIPHTAQGGDRSPGFGGSLR
jgi:hypothetical protein